MSRKLTAALTCALACVFAPAALARSGSPYYLALGDSLARGAQPDAAGMTVPTSAGYADFLYATERKHRTGLRLAKLGCLGETTTTMRQGGICHYAAGSQLAAAKRFIAKRKVVLITLDIGANDVDGCVSATGQIDLTCITQGVATIQANVPKILGTLRKAAGPRVKIAAITYYDPFLGDYLTGPAGQGLAGASVLLAKQVNGDLSADYQAQHVRTADVATSFDTYTPFTTTTTLPGHGTVPLAVAEICGLTWMCAAAPRGPNIHANTTGYREIAGVLAAALR